MLFNSSTFLGFFAVVYALYLLLRRRTGAQNALLLVASYVFYGAWDWRFLGLIWLSTAIDFAVGLQLADSRDETRRRRWLTLSVLANLGALGCCKYLGFFADGLSDLVGLFGVTLSPITFDLILPVGISFYTFQSLSYSVDVYRRRIDACTNPLDFALFVAFFPQLVAGPIERASRLLAQIQRPRRVSADAVNTALFLLSWGFFKKMVVADNAGRLADHIFGNHAAYDSLDLTIGLLAFTVQIYGDFSGYSDIARGFARLLGFDLMVNFRLPWFARTPSEFWRRWHISLSEWLRDYLYVPLGGNRAGSVRTLRNLMLTMLLGGLWHGAAWTYVLWGAYHGLLLAGHRVLSRWGPSQPGGLVVAGQILLTFGLTTFGWLLFRATSLEQAVHFATHLGVSPSPVSGRFAWELAVVCVPLLVVQLWQHRARNLLAPIQAPLAAQTLLHAFLLSWIAIFGVRESMEFLYFQF